MKRSIWAWARLLGGVAILAVLLWRLGTGAFLDGLRVIDAGTVALAFGIGVATTVFSAWRWCLVARGLGLRLSLRTAVADYYKALFINAALPGGVLGDVDRAVQHGREEGDVARSVRAVVLERTAGQIVLVAVGVVALLTIPSPVLTQLERHESIVIGAVAALMAGTAALVLARRKAAPYLAEVRRALLARRNWPGILLASTAVLAGHLATFVVAARAAGSQATLLHLTPLMLLALLAMSLPVNIGGWGPREAVTAWAFGAAGLSAAQGLTIAVVYGLFAFVAALPGLVVILGRFFTKPAATTAAPAAAAPAPAGVASTPAGVASASAGVEIVPVRTVVGQRELVATGA